MDKSTNHSWGSLRSGPTSHSKVVETISYKNIKTRTKRHWICGVFIQGTVLYCTVLCWTEQCTVILWKLGTIIIHFSVPKWSSTVQEKVLRKCKMYMKHSSSMYISVQYSTVNSVTKNKSKNLQRKIKVEQLKTKKKNNTVWIYVGRRKRHKLNNSS